MRWHEWMLAGMLVANAACVALGAAVVNAERSADGRIFRFQCVPSPALNDAGTRATFELIDGQRDGNGATVDALHDGRLPTEEDQPKSNFFLRAGSSGGRLRIDLGQVIRVKQVGTYSWHTDVRAPQVYRLYGADGLAADFNAAPRLGTDPTGCGWQALANVDTRATEGDEGGQHGVTVTDPTTGALGRYRYLLLDLGRTEDHDAFGHTFYSEIDAVDADGPPPTEIAHEERAPVLLTFEAEAGRYRFVLDATDAPDLDRWADTELRPVIQAWYPKIAELLPSEGFSAPTRLTFRFRSDLGGTPAAASRTRIDLNSGWFRRELKGEARGSVVHEMVHVVQSYGRNRASQRKAPPAPGWLVEGIADYVRWFLYEPEAKGAEITRHNLARANFDASYRITANFLNWVTLNGDRDIVRQLNAAAREGNYTEALWQSCTGKSLAELGAAWKREMAARVEQGEAEKTSGSSGVK